MDSLHLKSIAILSLPGPVRDPVPSERHCPNKITAEQALGPIVGPLAKNLGATQKVIQVAAKVQLDMFLDTHP